MSGFPYLRMIKHHLNNENMFSVHGPRDKFKTSFYNKFGECPFFESVLTKLDVCRRQLLQAFKCRFSGMDDSILWTSLFDSRYASALHLSDTEKGFAITRLKREIQSLIVPFTADK